VISSPAVGLDGRLYAGSSVLYAFSDPSPVPTRKPGFPGRSTIIKINYLTSGASPQDGYQADDGSGYGTRGTYGWH